ncbi:hypothetical protein [Flavobacterium sp.]|uniref:hypothetical protein n=1 Tax=Flavobacterium sp. TaxID=239 RepID=UPI00260356F2|nr:hypothetical protein [Flavobacterium sp.]
MTEDNYKPYYFEGVEEIAPGYFILYVIEHNRNEDFYTKIHLHSNQMTSTYLFSVKESEIFIDILSPNLLDFYVGQYYHESCDDRFEYTSIEWKSIAITSPEWKIKYKELRFLLDQKIRLAEKIYEPTLNKVITNFQQIYDKQVALGNTEGLTHEDLIKLSIFKILYRSYTNTWDGINHLINPNHGKMYVLYKDWKDAYSDTEKLMVNLLQLDLSNYEFIKQQMIYRYTKVFNITLSNLKFNYQGVDEKKFIAFFNLLMNKLKET